jgi:hypothetical protein
MIKHIIAIAVFAAFTAVLPASAQVYIQIAPPTPVVEIVPASPGSGYVWVPGRYNYNGGRYVWAGGSYQRHAGRYCNGHWRHDARGYVWVDGRWC